MIKHDRHLRRKLQKKHYLLLFLTFLSFLYAYHELKRPAPPTDLSLVYENQQNNFRENPNVYSIGDRIYFSTERGTFVYLDGKVQRSAFGQYIAQESEDWILYAEKKKYSYAYDITIYNKENGENVASIQNINLISLYGNMLYYLGESTNPETISPAPSFHNLHAFSLLTGEDVLLMKEVGSYIVLDERRLCYSIDDFWDRLGKMPIFLLDTLTGETTQIGSSIRFLSQRDGLSGPRISGHRFFQPEYIQYTPGERSIVQYSIDDANEVEKDIVYQGAFDTFCNAYNDELFFTRFDSDDKYTFFKYNVTTMEETPIITFRCSYEEQYMSGDISVLNDNTYVIRMNKNYWLLQDETLTLLK